MGALRPAVVLLGLFLSSAARAQLPAQWDPFVSEASLRFGVPEAWIKQVMRAESGGRTVLDGRRIVSRKGAVGLMQLMPGTWKEVRDAEGLGTDPHDPHDNILAGAAYLRRMYDRFGYPGLFAAYNAGPARYASHLATGRHLPAETVAYVAAVSGPAEMDHRTALPLRVPTPTRHVPPALFAIASASEAAPSAAASPSPRASAILFAIEGPRQP